jgi:predicted ATP-grasp superfamily ATP-dependent carboligase
MIKNYSPAVVVGTGVNPLNIIRTLGRKGISVVAVDVDPSGCVARSRYASFRACKSLMSHSLIDTLIDVGRSLKQKAVLFCTADTTVLSVSENRETLMEYYDFVLPSHKIITTLMSKKNFYDFATAHDLLVPKTIFTQNEDEIIKAADEISYPCVIKPEYRDSSWSEAVSPTDKVLFVASKDAFTAYLKKFDIANKKLLIQEFIDGVAEDLCYCLAYIDRNYNILALFTGRKLRQYPNMTGTMSLGESSWIPTIADETTKVFALAGCCGLCSLEFMKSRKDQRYYIVEPTVGRTDTQEGLGIKSGMDIPYLAYLDAIGNSPVPIECFLEGVKWIDEPLEFYAFQSALRNGNRNFIRWLRSYRGKKGFALFALDDPLPFLDFCYDKSKKFIHRIFRVLGS